MNDSHLERAVAPNLFDAVLDPALIFSLVLANMMSHRLWDLRERLLSSPAGGASGDATPSPASSTDGMIPRLQQMIDRRFEHVLPSQVVEMHGVLDVDAEADRLGSDAVEYALAQIQSAFAWRMKRGTFPKDGFSFDLIQQRKFPAYFYATIDEAHANRRFLRGRKHKPLGVTCCLDEAAIFTALNLILPNGFVEDIVLIGSPAHYCVFTWTQESAWWFYSKHELHSPTTWAQVVADVYGGDAQMAFDDRLPRFDRIITISGSFTFATGEASMSASRLADVVSKIEAFLGFRPAQLAGAVTTPTRFVAASDLPATMDEILLATSADTVQSCLRRAAIEEGHPSAWGALYAFRSLHLPDLQVYLRAALRSNRIGALCAAIGTVDDALACATSIPGRESIFEDSDRIALPDETARFATGSDRDKALLLHVLIERALSPDDSARKGLETLFTEAGSYVRSAGCCFSMSQKARVPQVEGTILHRIAAWEA